MEGHISGALYPEEFSELATVGGKERCGSKKNSAERGTAEHSQKNRSMGDVTYFSA